MALTVEDGTGLANADSYVSIAEADLYALNHGNPSAWRDMTEPQKEEKLRLATQGIDLDYHGRWLGERKSKTQSLDWPRDDVQDEDGFLIDNDSVPARLKDATTELAIELASGKSIHTAQSTGATIKRERKKLDTLETETEYLGGKADTDVASFPRVSRLLARFTVGDVGVLFRG